MYRAVPLMARMCPHDTYKVYKQGSRVRIDTTLLGFEDGGFERGDKSFIFQGKRESNVASSVAVLGLPGSSQIVTVLFMIG